MDKQMKVALIYRRNDLFDKYIEIVRGVLKEEFGDGFDIEQTFLQGTPPEEISRWYNENKDKIASYQFVLCDETCRGDRDNFCKAYRRLPDDRKIPKGNVLDWIFNRGTYTIIDAEFSEVSDLERQVKFNDKIQSDSLRDKILEETRRAYVKALQMVKEIPRTALILENHIYDHFPFRNLEGINPGLMLQEWFIEGGIPTVYYFGREISVKNGKGIEMIGGANWVIYDRHAEEMAGSHNGPGRKKVIGDSTVLLHLPFSDFIEDLKKNGLIDDFSSETTFRKAIERGIRRQISEIER